MLGWMCSWRAASRGHGGEVAGQAVEQVRAALAVVTLQLGDRAQRVVPGLVGEVDRLHEQRVQVDVADVGRSAPPAPPSRAARSG